MGNYNNMINLVILMLMIMKRRKRRKWCWWCSRGRGQTGKPKGGRRRKRRGEEVGGENGRVWGRGGRGNEGKTNVDHVC